MVNLVNQGRSTLVYLLLAIFLIGSAQLAFFLIGCQQTGVPNDDEGQQNSVYTREEFEKLILGKTEDEVLQAVGKPVKTSQGQDAQYWHYANRTMDPVTKKIDGDAQVVFANGRVQTVNY